MDRIKVFEGFRTHPWLSRVYSKLSVSDLKIAHDFITQHQELDKGSFEMAINRMFLDKVPPKRYREISELLSCANSTVKHITS